MSDPFSHIFIETDPGVIFQTWKLLTMKDLGAAVCSTVKALIPLMEILEAPVPR